MKLRADCVLFIAGLAATGTAAWDLTRYSVFQHDTNSARVARIPVVRWLVDERAVETLGRLRSRKCGLNVTVVEGDDEASLSIAAGHVPGTASLGAPGNSVVAGHRDTAFRCLSKIRIGDKIEVGGQRSYTYRVTSITIVNPDDVSVMAPGPGTTLTLITCYPFRHIGPAPKRFVVTGELLKS
ncbi:MAG: class D sortase [Acidobacteriota bacterium]|nr:class D sortase [Acidobacteriota bacterium]